jgi:hypothetical protein
MDGDPSVEDRLDSFSLTFPLPYRVAFIVVLGMLMRSGTSRELAIG